MSVWIEHPEMPGRRVEVPDLSLPHYRAAGWRVTEAPVRPKKPKSDDPQPDPAVVPEPAPEPVAETENETSETESPRTRRRTTKED